MTTGHLFDIASLIKVIGTTTAIMLLADHGLIRVDDPVGKYVPVLIVATKTDQHPSPVDAYIRNL